jgi:hypothetical protein
VLQYLFDPVAAGVMVAIVRRPGDEAICRRFSMKFLIVLMRLTNYNAIAPTQDEVGRFWMDWICGT